MEASYPKGCIPSEASADEPAKNWSNSSASQVSRFLREASFQELHHALEPVTSVSARASVRTALDSVCKDTQLLTEAGSSVHWIEALLAFTLPLLVDALPRDQRGTSVVPHPHPLRKHVMDDSARAVTITGQMIFETNCACDNCDVLLGMGLASS